MIVLVELSANLKVHTYIHIEIMNYIFRTEIFKQMSLHVILIANYLAVGDNATISRFYLTLEF